MENVLVTGGAGFLGSHVVDGLIEMGYNVTVLDDLSGGFKENVSPSADFIFGSIEDKSLLENLFQEKIFAYIFHLAANAVKLLKRSRSPVTLVY